MILPYTNVKHGIPALLIIGMAHEVPTCTLHLITGLPHNCYFQLKHIAEKHQTLYCCADCTFPYTYSTVVLNMSYYETEGPQCHVHI